MLMAIKQYTRVRCQGGDHYSHSKWAVAAAEQPAKNRARSREATASYTATELWKEVAVQSRS
jgi:hypothetical protein